MALNSYENRVWQVGMDEGDAPLIAKFYRPNAGATRRSLEEHAFTAAMPRDELPVVPPLAHRWQDAV
jgi:Ser/Thr protein kinase RdoA (MazF antagonist)